MKIKQQITWGLIFLLALILVLGAISIYAVRRLSMDSQDILKDNYRSLEYAQQMLQTLEDIPKNTLAINQFNEQLKLQQQNITEIGEQELTKELNTTFQYFIQEVQAPELYRQKVRTLLYELNTLNMQAIIRKNEQAIQTSHQILFILVLSILISSALAIYFISKFPNFIVNPIQALQIAKTNFIATISHELKTPISSIKLSTNLLNNLQVGSLNKEQSELVQIIQEDSERLLQITSELLKMGQLETGKIQLHIQETNLIDLIEYAHKTLKLQAQQKGITFNCVYTQPIPLVSIDSEKTAWVLINLLGNAVRYSPEQHHIDIHVQQEEQFVVIRIRDYGKGIAPEHQQKIFEPYFQVPSPFNKSGTGLGLSISKEFIEHQKGTIQVESKVNVGTSFIIKLPIVSLV